MANAMRGETEFEVDGRKFTLLYDANAFCEIEEELSTPERQVGMQQIMDLVQKGMSMVAFRAIVFGGLKARHPEMTLQQAGSLISEVGFEQMAKLLGEAITRAMPTAKAAGKKGTQKGN